MKVIQKNAWLYIHGVTDHSSLCRMSTQGERGTTSCTSRVLRWQNL